MGMSMDLSRLFMSSIAIVGGLSGCGGRTVPPGIPEVRACKQPVGPQRAPDFACNPSDCGPNSPIVNSFPINGFSKQADGACNGSGVQLLPRSLQGGRCGHGADLGLDPSGTRLVGTRLGKVVCTGEQLTGATFQVRSFASATLELTISNVRPIVTSGGNAKFEGYRIESGGDPACDPATAQRIRHQLGLGETEPSVRALPRPAGYQAGANDDLVIAVDGPLYDHADRVIADSRDHWFNLACAGDALAKRSLYGLYTAGDDAMNETALRMLTANYCGKPYTVPGVELEWEVFHPAGPFRYEEALWHTGKALCIGTPRLMTLHMSDGQAEISPHDLPPQLQPRDCAERTCDADSWTQALRAECQLPPCSTITSMTPPPQFEFESFDFDSDRNQIIVKKP